MGRCGGAQARKLVPRRESQRARRWQLPESCITPFGGLASRGGWQTFTPSAQDCHRRTGHRASSLPGAGRFRLARVGQGQLARPRLHFVGSYRARPRVSGFQVATRWRTDVWTAGGLLMLTMSLSTTRRAQPVARNYVPLARSDKRMSVGEILHQGQPAERARPSKLSRRGDRDVRQI
jgi:hypothetical protein